MPSPIPGRRPPALPQLSITGAAGAIQSEKVQFADSKIAAVIYVLLLCTCAYHTCAWTSPWAKLVDVLRRATFCKRVQCPQTLVTKRGLDDLATIGPDDRLGIRLALLGHDSRWHRLQRGVDSHVARLRGPQPCNNVGTCKVFGQERGLGHALVQEFGVRLVVVPGRRVSTIAGDAARIATILRGKVGREQSQ